MVHDIADILSRRVRVMSVVQIAAAFFLGDDSAAEIAVSTAEQLGLLQRKELLARPILQLRHPVVEWTPGNEAPHFGKISYQLKSRWREPVQPTEVVAATRKAVSIFGGYFAGRFPRVSEVTHDLHLADVFLWHRVNAAEMAMAWTPEAQLYSEGRGLSGRLPDVAIVEDGNDQSYVEFGGSYGKRKLEDFHANLSHLPYQIW